MSLQSLPEFLLPGLIFLAEMCVVTLGTLRIIFVSRGHKLLAPVLGFFEIVIWLFAIGQVMSNLTNGFCFLAFALGFTLGNYLGILIEKKLALGLVQVRVITPKPAEDLMDALNGAHFGVTCIKGEGASGPVNVLVSVVRRKHRHEVLDLVRAYHPGAFYSIEEIQTASEGIFPTSSTNPVRVMAATLPFWSKSRAEAPTKNAS